jgi:hypothetical protein
MTISSHEEILRLFRGNYALKLPRGTGKMPGILTSESGEVIRDRLAFLLPRQPTH